MVSEGRVSSVVFIEHCKRLLADNRRPVFLVVDGHSSHTSKMTSKWIRSTNGKLRLFYLPAYSPQLNPDEWAWQNVKNARIGRAGITSLEDLKNKAVGALERLGKTPKLVRGFFGDPELVTLSCITSPDSPTTAGSCAPGVRLTTLGLVSPCRASRSAPDGG